MSQKDFNLIKLGQSFDLKLDYPTFNKLTYLKRNVLKFQRLCEDYCNKENFDYSKIEDQESKIKMLIVNLPVGLNLLIEEVQHDPRGWTIKFNNYFFNNWIYGGQ